MFVALVEEALEVYLKDMELAWREQNQRKEHFIEDMTHAQQLGDAQEKVVRDERTRRKDDELKALSEQIRQVKDTIEEDRMKWMHEIKKKDPALFKD